jgi:MFS family permease
MGNDKGYRIYWDHLVLNASQVTNPSIDPLREPMELTTYLGRKPDKVELNHDSISLKTELAPQVKVELPVMFAAIIVISEISTLANRGQNMSLYWGFFLVGSSLGPTLGGFIGEYLGDRAAFFCFSGLAFLSTLWFYLRLPETKKRATNPGSRVLFTGLKPLLGNLNFALISTVALATLFTLTGSQLTIVPLLGYERFDLTRGQVGLALTLVAIMQFILVLVAGRLSDRFGRKKLIVPGNLIAVLGLVMFALSPSYFLYLMSAVILGIGRGVGGAIPTAYAADIAPPGNYENTMAVYRLASDSGFVLGPVILGLLKDTFGLNFPLFFSALLLFVPVVLFGTLAKETIHPS